MPMVRSLDGSFLLQAMMSGAEMGMKAREMRKAEESEKQWKGLVGNLYGQQDSGGVRGQYAPSQPKQPSFDEAFGADTQQAMEQGQPLPELPQQAPQQAPAYQGPRRVNMDVLQQMMILRPKEAGQIVEGLAKLDDMQIKRLAARNDYMGAAAKFVQQGQTPEERARLFQLAAPHLIEAGYTPEELDGIDNDLSDERLQYYQATAIDYDKIIDNELAARKQSLDEREFAAGKTVPVTAGGSVALVKPDGSAEYIIGGGGAQGADMPAPQSKADVDALPPGTTYRAPDGTIRQKAGGPTPQASGGFPGR